MSFPCDVSVDVSLTDVCVEASCDKPVKAKSPKFVQMPGGGVSRVLSASPRPKWNVGRHKQSLSPLEKKIHRLGFEHLPPQSATYLFGTAAGDKVVNLLLQKLPFLKHYYEPEMQNYVSKLIEDTFFCIGLLLNASDGSDIYRAVVTFLKLRHDGPVFNYEYITSLTDKLMSVFSGIFGMFPQSSDSPFESIKRILDSYESVKESPLVKKLYKFVCYIVCTNVLEKFGITFSDTIFESLHMHAVEKKKYLMGPDFLHCVADTLLYFCEVGYQCFTRGSFDPLYYSSTTYCQWFEDATVLRRQSLLLSNPEPHGFSRFDFLGRLGVAIEQGVSFAKHAKASSKRDYNLVSSMLNELQLIRDFQLTKKAACETRQAPFSVLLYGGSSVGKSSLTDTLFAIYANLHDLPIGDEYIYTRNAVDPHWNLFTTQMWGLKLDDIGFMAPNAAPQGDPSLMEVIFVNNNVVAVPPQADLCDKGRTPLLSRLVVATSNTKHLNAYAYFSCPLAVQRRLPWVVEAIVKPEYCDTGGMLDVTQLPEVSEGDLPDFWILKVFRVVAEAPEKGQIATRAKHVLKHTFYDMGSFAQWFGRETMRYELDQKKALRVSKAVKHVKVCKTCFSVEECDCLKPQALLREEEEELPQVTFRQNVVDRFVSKMKQDETEDPIRMAYFWLATYHSFCGLKTYGAVSIGLAMWWFTWYLFAILVLGVTFAFSREGINTWYGRASFVLWAVKTGYKHGLVKKVISSCAQEVGDRVERVFGNPSLRKVATVACATATTIVFLMFIKSYLWPKPAEEECKPEAAVVEVEATEVVQAEETRPKPVGDLEERYNPWYNDSMSLSAFDFTPQTRSLAQISVEDFEKMVACNCVSMTIQSKTPEGKIKSVIQKAIGLGGFNYLLNNHAVPERGSFTVAVLCATAKDGVTANLGGVCVADCDVKRFPDKDLCILTLKHLPPRKNILPYFSQESVDGRFKGYLFGRNEDGSLYRRVVDNLSKVKSYQSEYLSTLHDAWCGFTRTDTQNGDCGSVLIVKTAYGPVILGIHFLGGEGKSVTTAVYREFLEEHLCDELIVQSGQPKLSSQSANRSLGPLSPKSPFLFLESGACKVYGSFVGFRGKFTSHVGNTLFTEEMLRQGYELKFARPMTKGWKPWRIAAIDMLNPVRDIDTECVRECVSAFTADILANLPSRELELIEVFDTFTAVNGAAGVKFVDKLNRATSMGCPWKKTKKHFMTHCDAVGDLTDPVELDKEILDRIDAITAKYKAGVRECPVFCGNLKDQAVSFAKAESGKTRVFCGAPCDWSVVVRKYLLSFIRVMQRNPFVFEAAPGVVPQSLQWERIREYLTAFGDDTIVNGDYKAFDKRMSPVFILGAFDIIKAVYRAAGKSEEVITVLSCIAADIAFPFVDFNGDLVEFYGSNPSGHPLTVIVNCLVNALYMRYCFSKLVMRPVSEFRNHTRLITYGDDESMGVDAAIGDKFNHTTITKVLADMDITFTMADKTSESVPFVSIGDTDFLKRCWRFDHDVGAYLAPLDEESIIRSLMICTGAKDDCIEVQCVSIVNAACREWFNYGKETFEERKKFLKELITIADLWPYVCESTFPTFEHLKEEFWKASEGVVVERLLKDDSKLSPQSRIQDDDCDVCFNSDCPYADYVFKDALIVCPLCHHCFDFDVEEYCAVCNVHCGLCLATPDTVRFLACYNDMYICDVCVAELD